ncbi:hypothetical protein [Leucothrix arctica]|uniref:Lipoprotein n=1 Tax=Leucothrix arctica TaxID=1481894 RepID=A0A317C5T0_9GAMM|nr:hypothetical protein [Leucothrix arctica]PWQ93978.1 hypothetical protein DKT75_20505 [Leucothrix arctica]
MNNRLKAIIAAVLVTTVVGCTSNPATLDRKALGAKKISVIDLTSQDSLINVPSSKGSSTIGGLIGAGIDAAVNAQRRSTMAPIITGLGSYNPRTAFANKLKGIGGNSIANNVTVNSSTTAIESAENSLNIKANYMLHPDHQSVTVKTNTALKTSPQVKIYKRNFSAVSKIDIGTVGAEKLNVTEYLKKNPAKLKQAIESAMDQVVKQISNDINVGEMPVAK